MQAPTYLELLRLGWMLFWRVAGSFLAVMFLLNSLVLSLIPELMRAGPSLWATLFPTVTAAFISIFVIMPLIAGSMLGNPKIPMTGAKTCRPAGVVFLAIVAIVAPPDVAAAASLESCLAEAWPQRQIECLAETAKAEGTTDPCLRSDDAAVRWACVAKFAAHVGEAAHCLALPEQDLLVPGVSRDLCRAYLAFAWGAPEMCAALVTPNMADACYLQFVEAGGDKAVCRRIANPDLKSLCADSPESND